MAPIRFNPEKDLAPTPFDEHICRLALEMKSLGLTWQPHVGCFGIRITGLNRNHPFLAESTYFEFASVYRDLRQHSEIARKLVWLPTWHQTCLLCMRMGIGDETLEKSRQPAGTRTPTTELLRIYRLIIEGLHERNHEL